jgi:hypothetical protein
VWHTPLFFYYSWLKLQTLDSFIFISSCELEVFEGIDLLRLGKTLGIASLLKSHMHLHKFFIESWEINGKKGGSIVHFIELQLILDSFQTHLVEVKCIFVVSSQFYDNFSQGFRMHN